MSTGYWVPPILDNFLIRFILPRPKSRRLSGLSGSSMNCMRYTSMGGAEKQILGLSSEAKRSIESAGLGVLSMVMERI